MPGMASFFAELRKLTDDELIKRYDEQAKKTSVGTNYYRDELNRRSQDRQTKAMIKLTKWIGFMTAVVTVATVVNVIIAVEMWL